jgi:xanthine dehydrogenase molybdopterin-binding subunit B
MPARSRTAVGRNVLRKEGVEKVTGAARYVDDLTFPNLLHARTVRSTIPAGDILDVRLNFDTTDSRSSTIVIFRAGTSSR